MSKTSAPLTPTEAVQKAARLADRGDTAGAVRLYNAVLARDPGNKKAKKGLKALQTSKATSLTQADFQRVEGLLRRDRIGAARAETQRLLRLHPRQPALHNLLGVILVRLGDREAAAEALHKAIEVDPRFDDALYNLANVLSDLKRYPQSLACYEELIKRGATSPELYNGLGMALHGARRLDDAVAAFRRARKLRPLYPDALNNLGNTLNDLERHDEAIRAYEAALEIEPGHRLARLNLARSLVAMKRHAAALPLLAEARRATSDPAVLRLYAQALRNVGQRTAAIEVCREILARNPDDQVARQLLDSLSGTGSDKTDQVSAKAIFERYAARFEAEVTKTLGYDLPQQLPRLLKTLDGENAWYETALDLGCGTGLVGVQLRSFCSELIGVDITSAMLEKAAEKAVYDDLVAADIDEWLRTAGRDFDLVLAADVLCYVGALDGLFRRIATRMKPGARLIFSTEQMEGEGFALRPTGRYAHAGSYVTDCAGKAGLEVTHSEAIRLRKDRGEWLEGGLFVLTRPADDP